MTFKKLLVLDVNGLLIDTYFYKEPLPEESPDARVGNFYVYKRPFCEEFLQFCLDNFTVGIWSSAREYNVNNLVDYVFGGTKEKLAFSWHQSDCTDLGLKSPDNQWKPLFLKELSKLWTKVKLDLPWSEGKYGPSNTLLVDDTPYKALLNPPNTAIFPRSYTARDRGDNFLGGALRNYLEGIRDAASVQTYVESNPFGEPSITPASPLWSYVSEVLNKVKSVLNKVDDGVAQLMPVEAVGDEGNDKEKPKKWWNGKHKHYSDALPPVEDVIDEGNKEDRPKKWGTKQNYHSDLSQVANNHIQFSDFDFPSEAVESQSSEPKAKSIHIENRKAADKQCYNEGRFHLIGAGVGAEVDRPEEQHGGNSDGNTHSEGNESFENSHIPGGDDSSMSLKPYCMKAESNNKELVCERGEMKENSFVHASNNNYASQQHSTNSNRHWRKHRGTGKDLTKRYYQRNDTSRSSFRYHQGWKSEGRYSQDGWTETEMARFKDFNQRGHRFVNKQHKKYMDRHNSGTGYPNRNKPSFGYARHSQQRWGGRPVDAPAQLAWGTSIPDCRSWDQSQQDCRQYSNTRASSNASFKVLDSNFSTQPFNSQRDIAGRVMSYNECGRGQDGGESSYSWHEQGPVYERSNAWPERTGLNVNIHNPDRDLAVQPEAGGSGEKQWLNFASAGASSQSHRNAGASGASRQPYQNVKASSQPYRNAGVFSKSYRGQNGDSRQPYQNVGGSNQPYCNNWDMYRQGLPHGEYSRSRQSQDVRNL